jgi:DNA-binding LytR/AlgR family response regulator
MMQVLLVDDEELSRKELYNLLLTEPDINIIGEAVNGIEAVEQISRLKPDLVFLDIEMPGLNGFEVINSLNDLPIIVFVTAYDQYAIQAFEINALDYLLKPVSTIRAKKTVARVREKLNQDKSDQLTAIQNLSIALRQHQPTYISRLAAYKGTHCVLISLSDIIYINVEDKLVFVHTATDRFLINRTITDLEQVLTVQGFFQINRGTIINLEYLSEIIPWFSGTFKLKLSNSLELHLSRDRASHLKEVVGLLKKGAHE